jgi:hypothetical protein
MYKPIPLARSRSAPASLAKPAISRLERPKPAHQPARHPRERPGTTLLSSIPYPVFERLPEPSVTDRPADTDAPVEHDLTWSAPEQLENATRAAGPGLFVIERRNNTGWSAVYVGMSGTGVGRALRWIVQAPIVIGASVEWNRLRVRIAEAGVDASGASGRAALRRMRDVVVEAIHRTGARVAVSPGPASTGRAPNIRHLGVIPTYFV